MKIWHPSKIFHKKTKILKITKKNFLIQTTASKISPNRNNLFSPHKISNLNEKLLVSKIYTQILCKDLKLHNKRKF
jgi:hypothetical protein